MDPAGRAILPDFHAVADAHRISHGHDLRRRRLRLGGQNADFAENLPLLARLGVLTVDGEEVARLDGVVAPEVDLHQQPLAERVIPTALRGDDGAGALAAVRIAEARHVRDLRQRYGKSRHRLEPRTRMDVETVLGDDAARVTVVRTENTNLSAELVL